MITEILNILYKNKALDIKIIKNKNLYSDYIIITTGTSKKHLDKLSKDFVKNLKNNNLTLSGKNTEWIIIDTNIVTIHIMLENTRKFYNLETLYLNFKQHVRYI